MAGAVDVAVRDDVAGRAWTGLVDLGASVDAVRHGPGGALAVALSTLEGSEWNGAVLVLDAASRAPRFRTVLESGVSTVAWLSADVLAAAGDSGDVRIFRLVPVASAVAAGVHAPLEAGPTLAHHEDFVSALAVRDSPAGAALPEGTALLSASWDAQLAAWDLARPDIPVAVLEGHGAAVHACAWNPVRGDQVASASRDGTVRLWDLRAPRTAALVVRRDVPIHTVAFSPDGASLLAGTEAGSLLVSDLSRGRSSEVTGVHRTSVAALAVGRHPTLGTLVASGADDARVHLHVLDAATGSLRPLDASLPALEDYVRALDFSEDGATLVAGGWDHKVRSVDLRDLA